MSLYAWPVVIFLTAVTVLLGVGWWITRDDQKIPLARLADPRPLPGELPIAGYFDLSDGVPDGRPRHHWPIHLSDTTQTGNYARLASPTDSIDPYGPFPVDTGPLLLLSEAAAAVDAHEREVQAMIRQAQRLGMMP